MLGSCKIDTFRGSKSRNKVSVGEPAEGSLKHSIVDLDMIQMMSGSLRYDRLIHLYFL